MSAGMSVGLAPYQPGRDDAEVLDLRARVWGADHPHTSPAFLEWLFRRNPAGLGSGILLRRKGVAIGFAGLSPRLALLDGRPVRVAHGLDFMIDPGASKGLAGAYALKVAAAWVEQARAEGYAFGVNFPNANSYRLLTSGRLGWRRVLSPRLLVRPLPGLRLRDGLPARIPPALASLGGGVLARGLALYAASAPRAPGRIVAMTDVAGLAPAPAEAGIGFARDPGTLAWRYGGHPFHRYRIFGHETGASVTAGLVTAPRVLFGVASTLVVDAFGETGPPGILTGLVARAVADARESGAGIVGALACGGTALDRALRRSGFLPVPAALNPKPFHMVVHPLTERSEDALVPGRWRFAWGDMDVV